MVNMNTRRQTTDKLRPMYVMVLKAIESFSGNEVGFKSCNHEEIQKVAGMHIAIVAR